MVSSSRHHPPNKTTSRYAKQIQSFSVMFSYSLRSKDQQNLSSDNRPEDSPVVLYKYLVASIEWLR